MVVYSYRHGHEMESGFRVNYDVATIQHFGYHFEEREEMGRAKREEERRSVKKKEKGDRQKKKRKRNEMWQNKRRKMSRKREEKLREI